MEPNTSGKESCRIVPFTFTLMLLLLIALGVTATGLIDEADAKPISIAARAKASRERCADNGGSFSQSSSKGKTTTTCKYSNGTKKVCAYTATQTSCTFHTPAITEQPLRRLSLMPGGIAIESSPASLMPFAGALRPPTAPRPT